MSIVVLEEELVNVVQDEVAAGEGKEPVAVHLGGVLPPSEREDWSRRRRADACPGGRDGAHCSRGCRTGAARVRGQVTRGAA